MNWSAEVAILFRQHSKHNELRRQRNQEVDTTRSRRNTHVTGLTPLYRANRRRSVPWFGSLVTLVVLLGLSNALCRGQTSDKLTQSPGVPVVFDGTTLFYVQVPILTIKPEQRAAGVANNIDKLARNLSVPVDSIAIAPVEDSYYVASGDAVLLHVTPQDARAAGRDVAGLAAVRAERIRSAIAAYRKKHSRRVILKGIAYSLMLTLLAVAVAWGLRRLYQLLRKKIRASVGVRLRPLRVQSYEVLSAESLGELVLLALKGFYFALTLLLLDVFFTALFSFFPSTQGYATHMAALAIQPFSLIWRSFVASLPDLLTVLAIGLVAYAASRLCRSVFTQIGKGNLVIAGFYPEWADPTYRITRVLIIALTLVVVYPYLPGAESPAFKGVSLFLGVLVSLGSTSAVANAVAGMILTYMRPFKIGDTVEIDNKLGDIIEKSLLVTRICTVKNEEVTISNATVLGSTITNYSARAKSEGCILHRTVTIGYDSPWRKVHDLLLQAARKTEHVKSEPKPFVLQRALNDFFVEYEINVYTAEPAKMLSIYSDLHQNIQDEFNQAGMEIMSPHYTQLRDGNPMAIPEENWPARYEPRSFRIRRVDTESSGKPSARPNRE